MAPCKTYRMYLYIVLFITLSISLSLDPGDSISYSGFSENLNEIEYWVRPRNAIMCLFLFVSLGTGRLGERKEHLLPRLNSVLQSRPMHDYMENTRFIVLYRWYDVSSSWYSLILLDHWDSIVLFFFVLENTRTYFTFFLMCWHCLAACC